MANRKMVNFANGEVLGILRIADHMARTYRNPDYPENKRCLCNGRIFDRAVHTYDFPSAAAELKIAHKFTTDNHRKRYMDLLSKLLALCRTEHGGLLCVYRGQGCGRLSLGFRLTEAGRNMLSAKE